MLLSSYPFDQRDNERIQGVCDQFGIEYRPAVGDRDERIVHVEQNIADATIYLGGRLSEEQFARAVRLRWIHVPWAGVNALLSVQAIRDSTILITNASGIMADGVADQVMSYILLFSRALVPQIRAIARREWIVQSVEQTSRRILRDQTIGIIGLGAIGRAVAQRARAFGMRIVATRRTAGDSDPSVDRLFPVNRLHDLLGESDFAIITLPLTDQTRGLIGRREFQAMKPSAIIVNIARGPIIREGEMIDALRAGDIAGAALDVFEKEPLPADSPLWEMENVIVTPHSSGGFDQFRRRSADLFIENLVRFNTGQRLVNQVDRASGY